MDDVDAGLKVVAALFAAIAAFEVYLLPARRKRRLERLSVLIAAEDSPAHREALVKARRLVAAEEVGAFAVPAWRLVGPVVTALVCGAFGAKAMTLIPKNDVERAMTLGALLACGWGVWRCGVVYALRVRATRAYLDGSLPDPRDEDGFRLSPEALRAVREFGLQVMFSVALWSLLFVTGGFAAMNPASRVYMPLLLSAPVLFAAPSLVRKMRRIYLYDADAPPVGEADGDPVEQATPPDVPPAKTPQSWRPRRWQWGVRRPGPPDISE